MPSRKRTWGLLAGLGILSAVVAACGGGSSSSTGPSSSAGSSGATIQGQIVQRQTAALGESPVMVVLRTTLGVGLAEAAAGDPVSGATVNLLQGAVIKYSTTTTADGNFSFKNVLPGTYTIQVISSNNVLLTLDSSSTSSITVGAGDSGTIAGSVTQTDVALTVHVEAANAEDLVHNPAQLCHAVNIANASGRNLGDVIAARLAGGGHGWGRIAMDFGVSPSVLGNNNCTESQIADAAALAGGNGKGKGKGKGHS